MSAFENAARVFHACEGSEGWDACREYAETDAAFEAQAGPVPPTGREMRSDYVFAIHTNADGRVDRMTKIWNSQWALEQLGWV